MGDSFCCKIKKNKIQTLSIISLLVLVVFAADISGSGQPGPAPGHASEECIKASDLEAMKQEIREEIREEMREEISKAMSGINAEEDSFLNKKNNTAVTAKAAFQPIFVSTLLYKLYN